jgi:hypothetical protein
MERMEVGRIVRMEPQEKGVFEIDGFSSCGFLVEVVLLIFNHTK